MVELINDIQSSLVIGSNPYQKIFHDSDLVVSKVGSDTDTILSQLVIKNKKLPIAGQQILQDWYLSGPDYQTGEQISGKVILRRMMIQGRVDEKWRIYIKSISIDTWNTLGYRFPFNLPYRNNSNGIKAQGVKEYILEYFGDPDPSWINQWIQVRTYIKGEYENEKSEKVRILNKLDPIYLGNMKRWYHEGYRDPNTGLQVTGREVILRCIDSGEYTKQFTEYIRSIAKDYRMIEAIGFFLYSQEQTFRLMGIIEKGMKLEDFLFALGETRINTMLKNIPKENRHRSAEPDDYLQHIRSWYHDGYVTDEGDTKLEEIL